MLRSNFDLSLFSIFLAKKDLNGFAVNFFENRTQNKIYVEDDTLGPDLREIGALKYKIRIVFIK